MAQSQNLVKLKIDPPEKFSDMETINFEKHARKLKAYMSMTDKRFVKLMDWAEKENTPINLEEASLVCGESADGEAESRMGDTERLSGTLNYVLMQLFEDLPTASSMLEGIDDYNGLEAWRLIVRRYAKTKSHLALLGLAKVIYVNFKNDAEFETKFNRWELDIARFEKATGVTVPDVIKVGLILCTTKGLSLIHI